MITFLLLDCTDGDIRLMLGSEASVSSDGRVEMCIGNAYGSVCDDFWDELEAEVTCRKLGFISGCKTRRNSYKE